MKKLIIALVLLAFLPFASGIIWIQPSRFTVGGGGGAYEFIETFEGATVDSLGRVGFDNSGWIGYEAAGTPNVPHYTTSPAPLAGTYSLVIGDGAVANETHPFVTSAATVHMYFQVNFTALATTAEFLWFRDVSDNNVIVVGSAGTGALTINCNSASASTGALSDATTYHVWVTYTASTGADLYVATSSTKPGSPTVSTTGGSPSTTNATKFLFFRGGALLPIYDRVIADGTQVIGSAP